MDSQNNTLIPDDLKEIFEEFILKVERLGLKIKLLNVAVIGMSIPHQVEEGMPVPIVYLGTRTRLLKGSITVYPLKDNNLTKNEANKNDLGTDQS